MRKKIVFIGGGHSHAIALRLLGKNPLKDVHLTLISDTSHTPYSGMLPGYVAGFYSFEQTHINVINLAQFAHAELILEPAIALDIKNNQVICKNHPPINFDYLSIDIGSKPNIISTLGAQEYAIPAKPVRKFLEGWNKLMSEIKLDFKKDVNISIVGGGAGGVELALNIQTRLLQIVNKEQINIHLFHQSKNLLSGHNLWVSNRLEHILRERDIKLYLQEKVIEVSPQEIRCKSGLNVVSNYVFWVTEASAPQWIKTSGITTDNRGFILVNNTLQSVSHSHIFATGDIATIKNYPRPKAGVFAVRQGKPLYDNLNNIILEKPLKLYMPQKQYLSLIGTGDKQAIASWGNFGWQSPLLWYWKDYIDRQFMNQFN